MFARPHDLQGAVDVLGDLDGVSAVRFRSPASVLAAPYLWRDRARADSAPEHGLSSAIVPLPVTFVFSEEPVAFTLGDTSAVGGTLSNLQQVNATAYTATFTGAADTDITNASVSVTAGSWQEGNG